MPRGWRMATRGAVAVGVLMLAGRPLEAVEVAMERVSESAAVEFKVGKVNIKGSGKATSDVQRLRAGLEVRDLFSSLFFLATEGRVDYERRLPYDLIHVGGHLGLGRALNETTDLLLKYRLDHHHVYHTGTNADPAFNSVDGQSLTSALGLDLKHDSRDDPFYPTAGTKTRVSGELALEGLGGDYDFGRLETDVAVYRTPFQTDTWLDEVTLVEHLKLGWVEDFGETEDVPFFERYFVGGSTTVRGHRNRWLTPRGLEQQFVGGELQIVNNVEARLPIFTRLCNRQLSAAAFVDAGRAYRRFSDIGDFGYGVGGGLRYIVHLWKVHGVLRTDYGVSLDDEGDDSTARFHVSFGLPF